jgi:hypothetical protein
MDINWEIYSLNKLILFDTYYIKYSCRDMSKKLVFLFNLISQNGLVIFVVRDTIFRHLISTLDVEYTLN